MAQFDVIGDVTEYMHLARSTTAMIGSYLGMYKGVSRFALAQDAMSVALKFLPLEGYRQATGYRRRLLAQVARDLPVGLFNRRPVEVLGQGA